MKRKHRIDQKGMVAIIVTMIMMFVITLIVLGFAEVTRRNQREALDTQLGTQAYYAAETGVNDVVTSVKQGLTPASTTCSPFSAKSASGASIQLPRQLKSDGTVANTCLMIDDNPTSLIADTIAPTTDTIIWDVKNTASSFATLKFAWSKDPAITAAAGNCTTVFKTYPVATSWNCTHALLRVDILNVSGLANYNADTLANATRTLYLQPGNNVNPPAGIILGAASAYQGSCNTAAAGGCAVTITTGVAASSEYYVRITTFYATATSVTLTGTNTVGAGVAHFSNGQIVVDSTGRAQDQVKRIRVRIPLGGVPKQLPIFAVQGTDTICKDLTVLAPITYDEGACASPSIWP